MRLIFVTDRQKLEFSSISINQKALGGGTRVSHPLSVSMIPFINRYVNSGVLWLFSINGPPNLIARVLQVTKIDFAGNE